MSEAGLTRTVVAYGLPASVVTFSTTLTFAYIAIYATDVLLIAPATMGLIFGASRIWDGLTDPAVGALSDRTFSRLGRRRPWLLASALPIGLAGLALWSPPTMLEGSALVVWFTISFLIYMTAMTVFNVPHMALGAELSTDGQVRTRIFGFRHAFATIGVAGALIGGTGSLARSSDPRETAFLVYASLAVLIALTLPASVAVLRERRDYQGRGGRSPFSAFGDIARNPHGRLLVLMYFVEHMGTGATAILSPFVVRYVIGQPESLPVVFAFYVSSMMLTIPLWVALARRIDKKRAWLTGMSLALIGYSTLFTVGEGDLTKMCIVVCFTAAAASCGSSIGPSVQADIIDWDEHRTGERKEGAYFSAFTLLQKTSAGLMAMFTGFALSAAGFVPNEVQTPETRLWMRGLISLVPLGCFIFGILVFSRYSLSEAEHARIRSELAARSG